MKMGFSKDLSSIEKELRLIFFLTSLELSDHILSENKELFFDVDWDTFLKLVKHHRVNPLIYRKIKNLDSIWIPEHIAKLLKVEYEKNTMRMLHLCGEIEALSKLLSKNEIRTIFLKGPLLAQDLYGDVSLRTSNDIDLLIPIDDLERVEDLLKYNGYIKDDYIISVLNDWKWRHHHLAFYNPNKNIKIEVHWRLNPGPSKEPCFKELWDRRRETTLTNNKLFILGLEDLFFFLVTHGARHGWSRLRWLIDIKQITKKELDYRKLMIIMRKNRASHIGGQALILSSFLLKHSLSAKLEPLSLSYRSMKLSNDALFYYRNIVNLHIEPVPKEVATFHKNYLFRLMSWQQKILYLISMLYPFPVDAETLPLPKILHFLYFPLRPFLLAWRRTRKLYYRGEL